MNKLQKYLKQVSQKFSTLQFPSPNGLGFQVQKLIMTNLKVAKKNSPYPCLGFSQQNHPFISSLNLKYMLKSSGIATFYIDVCILLFILTLKPAQRLMYEIIFIMCVSMRNNGEACDSCIMYETL